MQNCLHLLSETKIPCLNKSSAKILNSSSDVKNWTNDKIILNDINNHMAKLLIETGCNINHKDYDSFETPIFRAILANNYDLVKLFVSEGADLSIRNIFGNDPLSRSIQLGRFKIARLLITADSPIRVNSCIYKVPSLEDFQRDCLNYPDEYIDANSVEYNTENFLQYSIAKYEEFLDFLQMHTQQPRSLKDLSRLSVRYKLNRPISKYLDDLGPIPKQIKDLLIFNDIRN